jgi:hypothetical protein
MKKKKQPEDPMDPLVKISGAIGLHIESQGWISTVDLITWGAEQGWTLEEVHKAIRRLDRDKMITTRPGPDRVSSGWESLIGKSRGSKIVYGPLSPPLVLTMRFITAPIGQVTTLPEKEKAADEVHRFMRGVPIAPDLEGPIVFTPQEFRAMLRKAYLLAGLSAEPDISEWAVSRIAVEFLGVTPSGPLCRVINRPINPQRDPVGEFIHEGLPPGSVAEWMVQVPNPPFTPSFTSRMLHAAQAVGFSPAGSGRMGGNRGLFSWEKRPNQSSAHQDSTA